MRAPLASMHVTSPYGPRGTVRKPDGTVLPAAFHNGVDLRAAVGTTIVAPTSGRLTRLTQTERGGLQLFLEGDQYRFAFVHLSDLLEPPGVDVVEGQPIALSGESGGVAPHLHLEVRDLRTGQLIDPMTLFGGGGAGDGGGALVALVAGGLLLWGAS